MPTVLITGCSSGFGLETAELFLGRGWKVVATMRHPREGILPPSAGLRVLPLDVTDPASVTNAFEQAGDIDVLVNNAGIGAAVPIELIEPETAHQLFETNMLGTLATIQAVLPKFRERRGGTIINVTSTVTLKPLPLVSVYRASKAAVNALSESLAVEMKPFGVRVHIVLPGRSPETSFGDNAIPHLRGLDNPDYKPCARSGWLRQRRPVWGVDSQILERGEVFQGPMRSVAVVDVEGAGESGAHGSDSICEQSRVVVELFAEGSVSTFDAAIVFWPSWGKDDEG